MQIELRLHPSRLEEKDLEWEETPLISSAKFGNIAVVEFLLSIGANIHAKNKVSMRNLFYHADEDNLDSNFAWKIFWTLFWKKIEVQTQLFDRSFDLHECCVTSDMET